MKILIVYAGKTGTTETCVQQLKKELHGLDVTLCNADKESPCIDHFDAYIIGSSVRYGALRPSIKCFLKNEEDKLCEKPLALFLCCGMASAFESYCELLFSKNLLDHSFSTTTFGGTLHPEKAGLWDRIVLHFARKAVLSSEVEDGEYTPVLPGILPENISKFAGMVRQELFQN